MSKGEAFTRCCEKGVVFAQSCLQRHSLRLLEDSALLRLIPPIDRTGNLIQKGKAVLQNLYGRVANCGDAAAQTQAHGLVSELALRQVQARRQFESIDGHIRDFCRQLHITLPVTSGTTATVYSKVLPGTILEAVSAEGCPADDGADASSIANYKRAPGLAHTSLQDDGGQLLFSALQHDVFTAKDVDALSLCRLSDVHLTSVVGELLVLEGSKTHGNKARARKIAEIRRVIKQGPGQAWPHAQVAKNRACAQMARATATAALVACPEKLHLALQGQTVDLPLFNISLLMPDEIEAWRYQAGAFEQLERDGPVELHVRDAEGARRKVQARIRVSQFMLSADMDELHAHESGSTDHPDVKLLGDGTSLLPGGRLKARLDEIEGAACAMRLQCDGLEDLAPCFDDPRARIEFREDIARMQSEAERQTERLESIARTLDSAARQLKSMCRSNRICPAGPDTRNQAAARLALVGHLMGEMPLLSCMSDNDLTSQLDVEIKFLASVAHRQDGRLPPLEPESLSCSAILVDSADTLNSLIADEPASACSARLIQGSRFKTVSNLAHTRLQTHEGEILYAGLRHDTFNVRRLAGPILARWSLQEMRLIVGLCLTGNAVDQAPEPAPAQAVDAECSKIAHDPEYAERFAKRATDLAYHQMAWKTATAAHIVAGGKPSGPAADGKSDRRSDRKIVDTDLFNVCLVVPGSSDKATRQIGGLRMLLSPSLAAGRVKLHVNRADGAQTVDSRIGIRGFPLPTAAEPLDRNLSTTLDSELHRLLGDAQSASLAGDAGIMVDSMRALASILEQKARAKIEEFAQARREKFAQHPETLKIGRQIAELKAVETRHRTNARTLESAALLLRQLWTNDLEPGTGNPEASMTAAALLALIGYHMGETPVLSCMQGTDLIDKLEREIETFALAARNHEGKISLGAADMVRFAKVRRAFKASIANQRGDAAARAL